MASTRKRVLAPRKVRLNSDDRREQILRGAIAFFSEVGFDGGTRDLAKRLGVTQPLIYRHFPSKEELIREVYNRVYVSRWQIEWEDRLGDRRLPLADRLKVFYRDYADVIFDVEWIRIYLFAGLKGTEINRWWMKFTEDHLLRRICIELRAEFGLPGPDEIPIGDAEIEACWTYHGGLFYHGVRRTVFGVKPQVTHDQLINLVVAGLLGGLPAATREIMARSAPPKRAQARRPAGAPGPASPKA